MPADPYKYFRVEARELLDQIGKDVLALEKATAPDGVARLLRLAHTLKGAARVVKEREIADRAHTFEGALGPLRGELSPVPRERIDALLGLVDEMNARALALAPPPEGDAGPAPRILAEAPLQTIHANPAEMDALLEGLTELHAQLQPTRGVLERVERAKQLAELVSDQLAAPAGRESLRSEKARSLNEELKGLLVGLERVLATGIDQIDRELTQVRHAAEQLRLVPAGKIFTALERTARDTAQALGKRAVFEGSGADVRLDAHVLGVVQSALAQVVKNAVAHGIEPEAEREAAGKPHVGRVALEVVRRGRRVVFVGTDDGRGVDMDAVRRALERRGLLAGDAGGLGTDGLLRLLLEGGVSTQAAVTEISGRGVGLDVVREAAQRLGGEVSVRTERGKGTTVELSVPLSIALVDGLDVEASGITATIPLHAVEQTLRLAASDVARTADGETIIHEGRVVPFFPLARALASHAPPPRGGRPWSAVIVRGAGGALALGVDRLLGTASVVLRSLPELATAEAVVAGASLDADGNPRLVLDPDALMAAAAAGARPEREAETTRLPILVIDDSLTTRMLERSILESAGYEADVATSGEEGLEKARLRRYGLFLVDIEMPGMDGFTFIERTRADAALRQTPAILVSSRAAPEDRKRGEAVGAIAYMVKSEFDQVALIERIREHVG